MGAIRLTIQHGGVLYEPPVEDGVQIEWERSGTPGKLTFTTVKVDGLVFLEGDQVCFYYNNKLTFVGYVFRKTRDKEHRIKVTCYDQIRYLKNKYTYVFEKKTATKIIKSLCEDFGLQTGKLDNTQYVIPAIVEEDKSALDIILDVLDETLVNTGNMFVLYDDCGKISIRNAANMVSKTLLYEESAENFDYTSSIDDETYNSIVLYYYPTTSNTKPTGGSTSTVVSGDVDKILSMARSQLGKCENPIGSNNIIYNVDYYGQMVFGPEYPWCNVFVWWVFNECGLSHLFYDGKKTASCEWTKYWFQQKNQWVTSNYQPGDVIFFDWDNSGNTDHVGIVESVNGSKITCIEGNCDNKVARVVREGKVINGAGRPAYSSSRVATYNAAGGGGYPTEDTTPTTAQPTTTVKDGIQIFTASSKSKINEWGLLRYFKKIDTPSNGKKKAKALLELYNRKTRELKVTDAFGDITVRGGTLIPVKLYLGDVDVNNYMLVEKVTHKFTNDHHTMDLTLEGGWE